LGKKVKRKKGGKNLLWKSGKGEEDPQLDLGG